LKKLIIVIIFVSLFFLSCEDFLEDSGRLWFDVDLIGTWESEDASVYSGKLIIQMGDIKIEGYEESQTPLLGDDNKKPFKTLLKMSKWKVIHRKVRFL